MQEAVTQEIVLGGGCFWCIEAIIKKVQGVHLVIPGYAGGTTKNPTYDEVCLGTTGHAEVVRVIYDPAVIPTVELLTIFFASHDPTTLNRQGSDIGSQYRSVIFYTQEDQKRIACQLIQDMQNSPTYDGDIVTEVRELEHFYEAEAYHHDYFRNNSSAPYCQLVIKPKIEKVQNQFVNKII